VHGAERHLPPKLLLQLALDAVVITVYVEKEGRNQQHNDQQNQDDNNDLKGFSHTSRSVKLRARGYSSLGV